MATRLFFGDGWAFSYQLSVASSAHAQTTTSPTLHEESIDHILHHFLTAVLVEGGISAEPVDQALVGSLVATPLRAAFVPNNLTVVL